MRILAISDISCIGRASLFTANSLLTAQGHEVVCLPIALLSSQTGGMSGYTYLDLGDNAEKILKHWESLNLAFDAIYTGYLGTPENVDLALSVINKYKGADTVVFVDPVLGDFGALYADFSEEMVPKMQELVRVADYIFPNATEWQLLTETTEIFSLLDITAVVTGVMLNEKTIENVIALSDGRVLHCPTTYVQGRFHCSGDVFASVFIGNLLNGQQSTDALIKATDFTAKCIKYSAEHSLDPRFGLPYEKFMQCLI